jgi:hypothetical protein
LANITNSIIIFALRSYEIMKIRISIVLSLFLTLFLLDFQELKAQNNKKKSVFEAQASSAIKVQYGVYMPGGDLKARFGNSSSIGVGFIRKTQNNILWGVDLNYHFGNNFNEYYIFDSLRTFRGNFITSDGSYGDVRFFQRGFSTYVSAGKLIPISKRNRNSGIVMMGGVGYLQHRIFIEVIQNNVKPLDDQYAKGYDRLTNGISLTQFVGYWYMHPRRRFNFYAGMDFSQSFTKNRRDWDIYLQRKMDEPRVDYLSGIKFGVVLLIQKRKPKDFYLN